MHTNTKGARMQQNLKSVHFAGNNQGIVSDFLEVLGGPSMINVLAG